MAPHEFDGEKYKKASAHQKEWGNKLIAELQLKGTERVLDLGCGDGVLTNEIASLVPRGEVVGIDSSRGMIETARRFTAPNLSFVLMDINELSFEDRFDLIFSNATLHWVLDHESLMNACHKALVVGGVVRFNFAGDGNCSHLYRALRSTMGDDRFAHYFDQFEWPWFMPTLDEYRSIAEQSGFSDIEVWSENADRFFPNQETMVRWIDQPSIVPFLPHVAPQDKPEFRDAVVAAMIRDCSQPDGRCFETFRRINVLAHK